MCEQSLSLDDLDEQLKPRTPNEQAAILAFYVKNPDLTQADVEEMKVNEERWRTPTTTLRGARFCAKCDQIVGTPCCNECGQTLGTLVTSFDLLPVKCDIRKELETIAAEMLKTEMRPRTILSFLHYANRKAKNSLLPDDVDLIFGEKASLELLRRRGEAS